MNFKVLQSHLAHAGLLRLLTFQSRVLCLQTPNHFLHVPVKEQKR